MTQKKPCKVQLEPNKVYAWCSCGFSKTEPLCDGSHRTEAYDKRSVKFQTDKAQEVLLCGCKKTQKPPYCDGTHDECKN